MAADQLVGLAADGLLTPGMAAPDPSRGWVFSEANTREDYAAAAADGVVWVPGLSEDAAVVSIEWADTQSDPMIRRILLHWLRVAGSGSLDADPRLFVWWCNHAVAPEDGEPPTPAQTAARWEAVAKWSDALTESGIGNSTPHWGTVVKVVNLAAGRSPGAARQSSGDDEPL